ncbi:MAG: hypothetical protein OHK0017_00250 [Patescibacteria group bacterium]
MTYYIFDFDGVIGNTLDPWSKFLAASLHIRPEFAKAQLISNGFKSSNDNFIKRIVKNYFFNRLREDYSKRKDLIFEERLKEIVKMDGQKAILTRNDSRICIDLLGEYASHFKYILGRNEASTKVKGFAQLFGDLDFKSDETLFFTDTVGDIKEAQKALPEKQIIAVSWGYHTREILNKHLPEDQIIDDFKKFIHS